MILGSVGRELTNLAPAFAREAVASPETVLYRGAWGAPLLSAQDTVAHDPATRSWLAFCGNPVWRGSSDGAGPSSAGRAAKLLDELVAHGLRALEDVDGAFAIAWWDGTERSLRLIRDRFGAEPLHYALDPRGQIFGSRAHDVATARGQGLALSSQGLAEFLTYCYLPGNTTMFDGVLRVPAGGVVTQAPGRRAPTIESWYRLSYASPWANDEHEIARRYRELLEASVTARLSDGRLGVFLSGGMDSSSVATFIRRHRGSPFDTFSFRCAGATFDESHFARDLARELGTRHEEIEYGETEALTILDAVTAMDSPFCDIGIEIGTWLLARAACGRVDYLLTGDGGDELWASHPVYAAQRLMRWYDALPVPRGARRLLSSTFALVKDSDAKRGLFVTMKRILPPASVSRELGHFRWRLYQTPDSLEELLTPALGERLQASDPFRPVMESFVGYDGPDDGVSKWLYSDYRTASSFYFNRLLLIRHFGLEARMPFYDRALVEYGARIPAHLKLEGIERTKRLFRKAMEGVLPDVINHRKDKLGHSVPFKNWLRGDGPLHKAVVETLTGEQFKDRGLFRPSIVQRLLAEHGARRHNHSHRLWALFVLEQWLRRNMD